MLKQPVESALNEQINAEFFSAYLYLAMSGYFEASHLPGFAGWMRAQAREEAAHAMRFFDFVTERGGGVSLKAIAQPPLEFSSALAAFEQALEHERQITQAIHDIHGVATREGDLASQPFLLSFIQEQVEEERTVGEIVDRLRLAGDSSVALLLVDRELAARTD